MFMLLSAEKSFSISSSKLIEQTGITFMLTSMVAVTFFADAMLGRQPIMKVNNRL